MSYSDSLSSLRPSDVTLVSAEPAEYDFDRIRAWCASPEQATPDCSAFLNAWNFFDDLAGLAHEVDTPHARLSRAAAACYDKLFWGCNLPAVTPPGERFEPDWRADELTDVRLVLRAGLDQFESELRAADDLPTDDIAPAP